MNIISRPLSKLDHGPIYGGKPSGITLHYTANGSLAETINECASTGLGYHYVITRSGDIWQTLQDDRRAWHAGPSGWNGKRPNIEHLAIALVSWGLLELDEDTHTYLSEARAKVPTAEVEWRPSSLKETLFPWQAATEQQEAALFELLSDLITKYDISPADICDHSECALPKGRKVDIGGTLSLRMTSLRQILKEVHACAEASVKKSQP